MFLTPLHQCTLTTLGENWFYTTFKPMLNKGLRLNKCVKNILSQFQFFSGIQFAFIEVKLKIKKKTKTKTGFRECVPSF